MLKFKKMMKKIGIVGLLLTLSLTTMAQVRYNSGGGSSKPKEKGFDPQKIVIGGGLDGRFWGGITYIYLAPMVGYKITPNFLAGVNLGYQYVRIKNGREVYNTTTNRYETYPTNDHLFSPGLWLRYNIASFFAHAQFEYHVGNASWTDFAQTAGGSGVEKVKLNYTLPSLLVGAGYRLPLGERVSAYIGIYYDVLQNNTRKTVSASNGAQYEVASPYAGGIRPTIGFGIGF